jgi:hypothetical protein
MSLDANSGLLILLLLLLLLHVSQCVRFRSTITAMLFLKSSTNVYWSHGLTTNVVRMGECVGDFDDDDDCTAAAGSLRIDGAIR